MSFIETVSPDRAEGRLEALYDTFEEELDGRIPNLARAMSLRPDLLDVSLNLLKRLMIRQRGLDRVTKELLACYVSELNSCEY